MRYYVVDASVIIKTLLNESSSVVDIFGSLLKDAQNNKVILLSSKLLGIEVGNGLRFSVKDKNEASKIFRDFLDLPIKTFVLTKSQKKESLMLSYDLGTTVYDTSYHVLAKARSAIFLTCDEDYFEKAKDLGDIELLG